MRENSGEGVLKVALWANITVFQTNGNRTTKPATLIHYLETPITVIKHLISKILKCFIGHYTSYEIVEAL
jgi:hypothetical protein